MSSEIAAPDKLQALRAKLESAATPAERVTATLSLAEGLWYADPTTAKRLLERLVVDADATGQTKAGLRAASMLSELLRRDGDLDASARYAGMLLESPVAVVDPRVRASGLNLTGLIHQERGELAQALVCFEEFLEISRETGFVEGELSALNQLAGIHGLQGDRQKALAYYRECLDASIAERDLHRTAVAMHNTGWALAAMGRWTEATEHFYRALALCEEHDFRDLRLSARMELGELALKRSDYESATFMFDAIVKAEGERSRSSQMYRAALSNLGWTYFRSGNHGRAEQVLSEAARLSEAATDRCLLAAVCRRRAEVAIAQGRLDTAAGLIEQAARHASDLGLRKELGEVLRVEGSLSAVRSNTDAALELFGRSEDVLGPLGDTYELALTRLESGRLLGELGRPEEALPVLQTAARTFRGLAVVVEAEDATRLLYRLENHTDHDAALLRDLVNIAALGLAPERLVEQALSLLCDRLRFEQGAVLSRSKAVAVKGRPNLASQPRCRRSPSQTDFELVLPLRQGRRLLGCVWLRRHRPLAVRVEPEQLDLVSRVLAPPLARLAELRAVAAGHARKMPGLRFRGVVGRDRQVLDVLAKVPRVATTTVPVLIRGESGTGKELVARALHDSGPRADRPFVTVNCAAVPEGLLEAEFFGVEAGAATGVAARRGKFELAAGGTIFLDEIGDMSPTLQAKLLRVLEDKTVMRVGGSEETPVDVWVIAATNMDLDLRERQRLFRSDLLYRINTVQLVLPPLRQRREDLAALTHYFIARTAQQYDRPARRASDEVLALFARLPWPGNIRQLQHAIERAVILAAGGTLETTDLPPELLTCLPKARRRPTKRRRRPGAPGRNMIVKALKRAEGNVSEAARAIGCSRAQFYRLLHAHKIPVRTILHSPPP